MPDVKGLVGIRLRILDHHLHTEQWAPLERTAAQDFGKNQRGELTGIYGDVEEGTGGFEFREPAASLRKSINRFLQLLSELWRWCLELLRQHETRIGKVSPALFLGHFEATGYL